LLVIFGQVVAGRLDHGVAAAGGLELSSSFGAGPWAASAARTAGGGQ
jgi:hypothetical protein